MAEFASPEGRDLAAGQDPAALQALDQASRELALLAADACDDRKAVDIRLIRVDEVSSLADWFVRAIARSVEDRIEETHGRLPLRREGQIEGRWVLLDYGELIVHVLTPQERSYYDLEAFWGHGDHEPYRAPGVASEA